MKQKFSLPEANLMKNLNSNNIFIVLFAYYFHKYFGLVTSRI